MGPPGVGAGMKVIFKRSFILDLKAGRRGYWT